MTLGRTGLRVSAVGLGCGGPSRLGLATGRSEDDAADVVRAALDLGVTFFDTAEAYGTETALGRGLAGRRDEVVISTKVMTRVGTERRTASQIVDAAEAGLKRLGTDHTDVLHFHGVPARAYPFVRDELLPAVIRLREQGKVRFVGITEGFNGDTGHQMLQLALHDDCWDVIMVGFNMLNPSARERVFPHTVAKDVGTLIMFAVRRALSDGTRRSEVLSDLGHPGDALDFLLGDGVAATLPEAAYRFCRHEPGADVILTGTGNVDHVKENVESLLKPALPQADLARLRELFGDVDSVSGS